MDGWPERVWESVTTAGEKRNMVEGGVFTI